MTKQKLSPNKFKTDLVHVLFIRSQVSVGCPLFGLLRYCKLEISVIFFLLLMTKEKNLGYRLTNQISILDYTVTCVYRDTRITSPSFFFYD